VQYQRDRPLSSSATPSSRRSHRRSGNFKFETETAATTPDEVVIPVLPILIHWRPQLATCSSDITCTSERFIIPATRSAMTKERTHAVRMARAVSCEVPSLRMPESDEGESIKWVESGACPARLPSDAM
jgi:hypothetical protein